MTTTKTIKFTPKFGTLEINAGGGTYLSSLLALGAVDAATDCHGIPTDAEGLRVIHYELTEALRGITSLTQGIGWLMANARIQDIPETHLIDIGWALAGLGEIGFQLASLAEFTNPRKFDD